MTRAAIRAVIVALVVALVAPLAFARDLVIDPHPRATFDPRTAVGATIDFHDEGENARVFTQANVDAMLSAGFHPLSYRLGTELAVEAWHWNPHGTWSDAEHSEGYWTSSSDIGAPIERSYGYRLPRRGNTIDQATNSGYSRIDDGDPSTFWKSNPYLDPHPQWLLLDLGAPRRAREIRITWGDLFAAQYVVERWIGRDPINESWRGRWAAVPGAYVTNGHGGTETLRFAETVRAQYVRVWMSGGAGGRDFTRKDWRDNAGYAVREISLFDDRGRDLVRHGASNATQTIVWTSSTDPWHRASDIDTSIEQLGLDAVFTTGLTRNLPMLTPVALLYGTPEDAAAEVRYLRARGRNVQQLELGEEPDGQFVLPEDYAALFMRWAKALHEVDPSLQLGGPALQSTVDLTAFWPDERGKTAWMGRFIDKLRMENRLDDFAFFSFEWYPFDQLCGTSSRRQLLEAPQLLDDVMQQWRREGVPQTIPWLVTEYGFSSYAGRPEVDLDAALFNSEFIAEFLARGGSAAYFYGLEPDVLIREEDCPTYGNLALFVSDEARNIRFPLAAFHAATMLTRAWLSPAGGTHELHDVRGTTKALRAFAVRRPDGSWGVLAINKSSAARRIRVRNGGHAITNTAVEQLSPREYAWHARGANGYARPNRGPRRFRVAREVTLPPMSVTVLQFTDASGARTTTSSSAAPAAAEPHPR